MVIPALDEEEPIGDVVRAVPAGLADEVLVVDNGSTDRTADRARAAGARVIDEPRRGYGRACHAGVSAVAAGCDIIVFLDGDGSDCPELMPRLVEPIIAGEQDFVIGSRIRGRREPGSLGPQQVVAGRLAGWLIRLLYGARYTDMGPFRAIRRTSLEQLQMSELTYGWNLEMQIKAAQHRLRILEIPVDYRKRIGGASKVSGDLRASLKAGIRILEVLFRVGFSRG